MASSGKGLPFIGKMGLFLDRVLHPTVQKVGNSRAAVDVIHRGYFLLNGGVPYTVEAGSDNNIVKVTGHGFKPGDLVRFSTTSNTIAEFEIVIDEIVDANTVILAGYLSASLTAGDLFYCSRAIAEQFSSSGTSLTTLSASPVQYNRKTGGVTAVATVTEDIDTPALSRGLPVVVHGLDAAVITVTGDQINIASSHVNDSIRLGDGTTLVNVTAANALKTDSSHVTQPVSGTFWQATQPVSGIFWQATQPVSGAVSLTGTPTIKIDQGTPAANHVVVKGQYNLGGIVVSDTAEATIQIDSAGKVLVNTGTVAVTGAFYQATQPVSIASMPSTPVTGTFWQATQPVSIATMPSTPVTGTFYQATQPVSLAAAVKNFGTAKTSLFAEYLTLTTVQTFTAPANAIGALIQAADTNTANVRFRQGTATTTSGMQLQSGRSENIYGGSDITVCSESGTNAVSILWFIEAQS